MPIGREELDHLAGLDWQSRLPPVCPDCEYNLTGCISNRCPECGRLFQISELKRNAAFLRVQLEQLEGANEWARIGLKLGLVGVGFALFGLVLTLLGGGWALHLGRALAVLCGIPTLFMGLNVVRVLRMPAWCRAELRTSPDYNLAAATTLLALVLLLWGIWCPFFT